MSPVVTEMREVSIAVPSIATVAPTLAVLLGSDGFDTQLLPQQPIAARFRSYPVGSRSIAFMEAAGANTAIERFISRRGGSGGLFSASFATEDIAEACARMRSAGAQVVLDEPMTLRNLRSGSWEWDSIRVNFVALSGPMSGMVIELQELHGGRESDGVVAPGSPTSVNEVHFACRGIDAAAQWLGDVLGLDVGPVVEQRQPPEEVRFRNLFLAGKPMIAVIEPATETSTIHRFLSRRGPGMFALSLSVDDCEQFTESRSAYGVPMLFDTPKTAHETYVGPFHLSSAKINWVKPNADTGNVLFEIQEFAK